MDYMSGSRALELEIYDKSGIRPFILELEGSPLGAPRGKKISRWREMAKSFGRAKRIIVSREKQNYDLCVMFGGYVSLPALSVCKMRKIRSLVHEQNAVAGTVTRIASALNIPVASGWNVCEPLKKNNFTYTGIPVRKMKRIDAAEAWRSLGFSEAAKGSPVVVATTGSIGSAAVGQMIEELALDPKHRGWSFLFIDSDAAKPEKTGENFFRLPRMWNMEALYSVADILVTRAGASTLAEVAALGIPALVIPWRGSAKDHQMKNALQASKLPGIVVWDEKRENAEELSRKIGELNVSRLSKNGDTAKKMYNVFENVCGSLWGLTAAIMKGEIHFEGR